MGLVKSTQQVSPSQLSQTAVYTGSPINITGEAGNIDRWQLSQRVKRQHHQSAKSGHGGDKPVLDVDNRAYLHGEVRGVGREKGKHPTPSPRVQPLQQDNTGWCTYEHQAIPPVMPRPGGVSTDKPPSGLTTVGEGMWPASYMRVPEKRPRPNPGASLDQHVLTVPCCAPWSPMRPASN